MWCGFPLIFATYCGLAYLSSGGDHWWHVDIVSRNIVFWGDDAYRYYLARTAWQTEGIWWFNFDLPVALVLDSLVLWLSGSDLFIARCIKAGVAVFGLGILYSTLMHLCASRRISIAITALVATMPLYAFVSMSFYGEAWLMFVIMLALYFSATGRQIPALLTVGITPLIRPDGAFLVAAFCLHYVFKKNWRAVFIAPAIGAVYALAIILFGPGVEGYGAWRLEITEAYRELGGWLGGSWSHAVETIYPLAFMCALAGLWLTRKSIPLAFAFSLLITYGYLLFNVAGSLASFEPRYLAGGIPVIAVGFACFLCWLSHKQAHDSLTNFLQRKLWPPFSFALIASAFLFNAYAMHATRIPIHHLLLDHSLPAKIAQYPLEPGSYTHGLSAERLNGFRELARVTEEMLSVNRDIKTLFVGNIHLFYFLDPAKIPRDVRVTFPAFRWTSGQAIFGESLTGYFPLPPYAARFSIRHPEAGKEQLLYVDNVRVPPYPFHWRIAGNDVYLFGARMHSDARLFGER